MPNTETKLTYQELQEKVDRLEQALQDKNRLKLRAQILSSVRDSILVTDIDGIIMYCNEPSLEMYGYAREDLIGLSISEINPTFNLKHFLEFFQENKHIYEHWEWTYNRPETNDLVWISGKINPIYDESRRVIGVIDVAKDNTNIKKREAELLKRHHQLSSLIDSQTSFLVRTDVNGCLTYSNKAYTETFELSWKRILGEPYSLTIHYEDRRKVKDAIQKCILDPGQIFQIVVRTPLPTEELIWTEWEFVGIFDKDGEVTEIQGVGKNINERKKAEIALKNNEQKYKSLFESNPQMLLIYDASTLEILNANEVARNKYKYSAKVLYRLKITDLFVESHQENFMRVFKKVSRKKHSLVEWKHRDRRDRTFYASLSANTIEYEGKRAVLLMVEDISIQVEAQRQLEEVSNRLFIATKTDNIAVWDYSLETQEMVWDSSMYTMYGIMAGDSLNLLSLMFQRMHPEDIVKVKEAMNDAIENQDGFDVEYRILPLKGKVVYIRSHGEIIREKGKAKRIVGVNLNITELKQIETDLRENNAELRKTNRELDQFVYSTSHNLRSPLSSILGLVDVIKQSEVSTSQNELLSHIKKSVHKLDETIHEITDYFQNARTETEMIEIDFQSVVKEIIGNLSYLENVSSVDISVNNRITTPFYSDYSRIKMILQNLISNGIKFYNPYKNKPFIQLEISEREQEIEINVIDNGMGIKEEHYRKIFEMFYRATNETYGSGLGLYIVKEAVEKLSGKIRLGSKPSIGSTFTITLPRK